MAKAGNAPHSRHNNAARADQTVAALDLRRQGYTFRQIAVELKCSVGQAHKLVNAAVSDITQSAADELRKIEVERLDGLTRKVYEILAADHVVTQLGKVVRDERGEPIPDHEMTLKCVTTALKIQERLSRLLGLDRPTKTDITYREETQQDLELKEMLREADARAAILASEILAKP